MTGIEKMCEQKLSKEEINEICNKEKNINRLKTGDVAILKGELWEGNENAGLVHRSPQVPTNHKRFLLTLDYI